MISDVSLLGQSVGVGCDAQIVQGLSYSSADATSFFAPHQTQSAIMLCCTLTSRAYASPCQRSTVACRSAPSGIVVARAKNLRQQLEQQLQFEPDIPTWFTAASRWRLFGFAATACSQKQCRSADGTEYVSMAAYDLASGELFSTLINPKLHDSGYRLLPGRLQGVLLLPSRL